MVGIGVGSRASAGAWASASAVGVGVGGGGASTVDRRKYVYSVTLPLKTIRRPPVSVHSPAIVIGPSLPVGRALRHLGDERVQLRPCPRSRARSQPAAGRSASRGRTGRAAAEQTVTAVSSEVSGPDPGRMVASLEPLTVEVGRGARRPAARAIAAHVPRLAGGDRHDLLDGRLVRRERGDGHGEQGADHHRRRLPRTRGDCPRSARSAQYRHPRKTPVRALRRVV